MDEALFLEDKKKTSDDTASESGDKEQLQSERWLYCRFCGHRITSVESAVEMNGRHHHTFFNPAGIVYEIRCFGSAQGCSVSGEPSIEFTWFAGYTWQIALCDACHVHTGWFFSSGKIGFFGLISSNLSS